MIFGLVLDAILYVVHDIILDVVLNPILCFLLAIIGTLYFPTGYGYPRL